jgi:hypothetical protein
MDWGSGRRSFEGSMRGISNRREAHQGAEEIAMLVIGGRGGVRAGSYNASRRLAGILI